MGEGNQSRLLSETKATFSGRFCFLVLDAEFSKRHKKCVSQAENHTPERDGSALFGIHPDGHWPVIQQLDLHIGGELARLNLKVILAQGFAKEVI